MLKIVVGTFLVVLLLLGSSSFTLSQSIPAPLHKVWPQPLGISTSSSCPPAPISSNFRLKPNCTTDVDEESCAKLVNATRRYQEQILNLGNERKYRATTPAPKTDITHVEVILTPSNSQNTAAIFPDESYTFHLTSTVGYLHASTFWGALRGLETVLQLLDDPLRKDEEPSFPNGCVSIVDAPRFSYRGLMMDLSRHFYPVSFIEHTIEAMVANKLNVLHLHLTDDASFPVALASHPELASKGAFGDDYVYSTSQLAQLDAFADTHGVRIVPEFDMPAHSSSWRAGIPSMVVAGFEGCSSSPFLHGDVLDPTTNVTYDVIQRVVSEIKSTFANAPIVHLGGDEVPTACWLNSPNVTAFMKTEGFESAEELVGYFLKRVASTIEEDVKAKSASSSITKMYWEEAFTNDNGSSIPRDAIVHVWKQNSAVASAAVATGRRCVLSSGFYLNHGPNNYGDGLWEDFYENEPSSYSASPLLLGGAAAMWSERVDQYNFDGIVWPRAAATAEVLWSPQNYTQAGATANVSHRLAVHRCRMVSRGVRSGPLNDMNDPRGLNPSCM